MIFNGLVFVPVSNLSTPSNWTFLQVFVSASVLSPPTTIPLALTVTRLYVPAVTPESPKVISPELAEALVIAVEPSAFVPELILWELWVSVLVSVEEIVILPLASEATVVAPDPVILNSARFVLSSYNFK